jgi:hypothetical protein
MTTTRKAFVISHSEHGIFLGTFSGVPLWTKIDMINLDTVCAFESIMEAIEQTLSWSFEIEGDLDYTLVDADRFGGKRSSISACIKAGLDGWLHNLIPEGNC